jgi:Flp pilus assembly protein TadD
MPLVNRPAHPLFGKCRIRLKRFVWKLRHDQMREHGRADAVIILGA